MNKKWKIALTAIFSLLFISGFFFLDSDEVLYNQEKVEVVEISIGQKRNIMSYIEIAKFKFHNLIMEEHAPNPKDMDREELEKYLSNYFADPIISELIDYWSGDKDEMESFVKQFISLSSEIEEPEYIYLEKNEVLVRWYDEKLALEVNVIVEKKGIGWLIKDIELL